MITITQPLGGKAADLGYSDAFPIQFQHESLRLVNGLLDLTSSVFYVIDPEIRNQGVALSNLDVDAEKQYRKKYGDLDPLNPRRFHNRPESVVTLDSQMSFNMLRQSIYFTDFMKPLGHRYVADVFLRCQGEVVAVLSVMRSEEKPDFSAAEISTLKSLQPFMEYALNSVYLPRRYGERKTLQERYQLTRREIDVLELVVSGLSNKSIANELGLGLATVKTHLINLYRKTEAVSRTELLYRIMHESPVG